MRTKLLVVAVALALTAGCSSAPTNPYAAETSRLAATTATAAATASMQIAPAVVVTDTPTWFSAPPPATATDIYVAGTGLSKDLGFSKEKAIMDAQAHLADRLAAEMSTMSKRYKAEQGENFVENYESVARKVAADVKLGGWYIVESKLLTQGGGYRFYVLLKFPLTGAAQKMLAQSGVRASQAAAETEMDRRVVESRQRNTEMVPMQRKQNSPLGLNDGKEED